LPSPVPARGADGLAAIDLQKEERQNTKGGHEARPLVAIYNHCYEMLTNLSALPVLLGSGTEYFFSIFSRKQGPEL
jgi:hypothetical protein